MVSPTALRQCGGRTLAGGGFFFCCAGKTGRSHAGGLTMRGAQFGVLEIDPLRSPPHRSRSLPGSLSREVSVLGQSQVAVAVASSTNQTQVCTHRTDTKKCVRACIAFKSHAHRSDQVAKLYQQLNQSSSSIHPSTLLLSCHHHHHHVDSRDGARRLRSQVGGR